MARKAHPVTLAALQRGESLRDVADAVGVTKGSLHAALNHGPWPSLKERLSDYLGVPVEELFPDPVDRLLAEREAQGFSPTVDDLAALQKIAAIASMSKA